MPELWQPLFANVALIAIVMLAWQFLADVGASLGKLGNSVLFGTIMAAGAIVSIQTAPAVAPGLIFDLRTPLIGAACFFGGIPAGLLTATAALLFRLHLGGAGVPAGILGIVVATTIGMGGYWLVRNRQLGHRDIVLFALAMSAGVPIGYLALPQDIWLGLLAQSGPPIAALVFVSVMLIGTLLLKDRLQREMMSVNSMFRAMVEALPDSLNAKDMEGRFIVANPATAKLMGAASPDELIGKTDFDYYTPDVAESFVDDEQQVRESGTHLRIDQPTVFTDGSSGWLSTVKAPLRSATGDVIGIITHNRNITEERRNAEIKSEFISTVSHELRTPLTSIRGSLGLMQTGVAGSLPPKAANLVRIAHKNSERLVLLINSILDMEKLDAGKVMMNLQRSKIRPLVEAALESNSSYMPERRIKFTLIDDVPDAEVNVDVERLQQVMSNILSNAVKYSHVDGAVQVRIEQRGQKVRISVSDTGAGIPESFHSRMFSKFERADTSDTREMAGTGLGLSIVKAIMDQLGGKVGFESEIGKGSTFHIELPIAAGDSQADFEEREPAGAVAGRVLVCVEGAAIGEAIAIALQRDGLATDVTHDVATATALLGDRSYVAMALDFDMAGDSGMELLNRVRSSSDNQDIPVIVISAVLDGTTMGLSGSAVGIVDWLPKPVDPTRLRVAMQKIVGTATIGRPMVLHIDDDPDVLEVTAASLGNSVTKYSARSMAEARDMLAQRHYDLMILDVGLPDGSGLDLLPDTPNDTSVIIYSATEFDRSHISRATAIRTKTKTSELDVAELVKSLAGNATQVKAAS